MQFRHIAFCSVALDLLFCRPGVSTAQTAVKPLSTPAVRASGAAKPVDFARDVLPALKASCFQCHGVARQEGGLAYGQPDVFGQRRRQWDGAPAGRWEGESVGAAGTGTGRQTADAARICAVRPGTDGEADGLDRSGSGLAGERERETLGLYSPCSAEDSDCEEQSLGAQSHRRLCAGAARKRRAYTFAGGRERDADAACLST